MELFGNTGVGATADEDLGPAYPGVTWRNITRTLWITAAVLGCLLALVLLWDAVSVRAAWRARPARLRSFQVGLGFRALSRSTPSHVSLKRDASRLDCSA